MALWSVCPLQPWSSWLSSSLCVPSAISSSPQNPANLITAYLSESRVRADPQCGSLKQQLIQFPQLLSSLLFSICVFVFFFFHIFVNLPTVDAGEGSSNAREASSTGPRGFRKHFMSRKLDSDNQPPNPDILFQRCFPANVTCVKVESPP